jgi:hypothetical protein
LTVLIPPPSVRAIFDATILRLPALPELKFVIVLVFPQKYDLEHSKLINKFVLQK